MDRPSVGNGGQTSAATFKCFCTAKPASPGEGAPNKKVRVVDPNEMQSLKKLSSDLDSGDLSSASDWGSNEDVPSLSGDKAGTLSIVKRKRMYNSEMSSVSASSNSDSNSANGSDTGSDNGGGSGPGSDMGDKVETDSHSSIASLLDAARAADKKDQDE